MIARYTLQVPTVDFQAKWKGGSSNRPENPNITGEIPNTLASELE